MARADNAGQESKRQEDSRRRVTVFLPIALLVAILAVVGVLGFGAGSGVSKEQVRKEVAELLEGVPQDGAVLGSPKARITLLMYADLGCPTVKLFVENYLPLFVDNWVRTGVVRIDYRSLETDTINERVFFDQETAALAAGRQDKMWDFLLLFARQQGEPRTDYATEEFITGIASQVPGLDLSIWRDDRRDPLLSRQVALGVYRAHRKGFHATPSFSIGYSNWGKRAHDAVDQAGMKREVTATLKKNMEAIGQETLDDIPALQSAP